jgi:predicted secreted hydrolase
MPFPIVDALEAALDSKVDTLPPVRLPADELAHDYPVEWWYFAIHLSAVDSDERLSVMLTAIRGTKRRLPIAATVSFLKRIDHKRGPLGVLQAGTAFRLAYDADTKRAAYRFRYEGSILDIWNASEERWTIVGEPTNYRIELFDGDGGVELALDLVPTSDAVLLGNQGVVDYGNGHQLAYYARPKIVASGEARIGGKAYRVHGPGWYERQWGTAPTGAYAWKYVNISLDDDEQWIFFHTHMDGEERYAAYRMPSGGGIEPLPLTAADFTNVDVDGRPLGSDLRLVTPSGPVQFQVRPLFGAEPDIKPVYPGVPGFWESACRVDGTRNGQPIRGWSMTELHAYG